MLVAVCCQGDDALALFDAETGSERGMIPVGSDPVHATAVDGRVLVATMGDRAVTVVDTDGSVRTVRTGVLGPSHFAASSDHVYVPCTAGDVVAVLDRDATATIDRIPVGAEPHEINVLDDVGFVGSRRDGSVTVFETGDSTVCGRLELAGDDPRVQGVEAIRDDGRAIVYAVDQRNTVVTRFDVAVESLPKVSTATATVGSNPYDLSLLDDRLFVPGRDDGTVHELTRELETIAVHDVGGRPVDVFGSETHRWIVDRDEPRVRSLEGRSIETAAPAIEATPVTTDRYLLSHYDDDAVSLVDVAAEESVWTRETPARPFGTVVV